MTVRVGSCSWTDKTLIACGRFYPPRGCSTPEQRLRFYASQFPLVEVDSSYYAMPTPDNSARWVERTPDGFVFNIKAFRLLTNHQTAPEVFPKDIQQLMAPLKKRTFYYRDLPEEIQREIWRRFREAIEPLRAAGKLHLVHFQFPPWLLRNRAGHDHVRHCVEMMAGHTLSVEFRNRIWFEGEHTASTLAFERELGVVHTVVDAPQGFENSVPQVWEATHPRLAYVRLHGRNAATWNVKGSTAASDRFNYDYPDAELESLGARVAGMASKGLDLDVQLKPTADLTLSMALGYDRAEYTQSVANAGFAAGLSPVQYLVKSGDALPTPKWTAALGAEYGWRVGDRPAFARVDWQYVGGYERFGSQGTQNFDPDAGRVATLHLVNLRTGVKVGAWDWSLYLKNALNSRTEVSRFHSYTQSIVTGAPSSLYYGQALAPRMLGASANVHF